MRPGGLAAILALVLSAGPALTQEVPPPPLPLTGAEPVVDQPSGTAVPGPAAPIIVHSPAASGAVVTVDQDRLFSGSIWGRRLQAEFERAGIELSAENERLATQLSDEEAQLTQQRATLDPAEFRRLAEAFDVRATEIRRERAQAVQDLSARGEAAQAAFFQAAAPLIGVVMQERGAVVVLDRRSVLLSAEGIDITNEMIARIDAELGDGSTVPPVPPANPDPQSVEPDAAPATPDAAPDSGAGD